MSEEPTGTTPARAAARARLRRVVAANLVDKVPRDHQQSDAEFRRRRVVVAVVLVVGATLLGISLNVKPGDATFYPLTLAVAAVWIVGGFLSGPLHLGYLPLRGDDLERPVRSGFVIGVLAGLVFLAGAFLVRLVPPLYDFVADVLDHARYGSIVPVTLVTLINGIGEEIFFRGGLFAAIGRRHPVAISTAVYAVATIATLNPMLVFAAATLGVVLALQRRASGGILAPIITHCTWSMMMLFLLPPLFS
ncbi:lysostaphin resistance A-like protein [Spongisporangium articulatum]|uniref:Lysostaphin resistance A-like protein n=1 Tax=Spongisporangium articulatum TaxID=3362603 RepID=A0ABW8AKK5_9ACTN